MSYHVHPITLLFDDLNDEEADYLDYLLACGIFVDMRNVNLQAYDNWVAASNKDSYSAFLVAVSSTMQSYRGYP